MIEVEKSFILTKQQQEALTRDADFVKTKKITDTYFDMPGNLLTLSNRWLRSRNGHFELKTPIVFGSKASGATTVYHELETEPEIRHELQLVKNGTLPVDLEQAGYQGFITCHTVRDTYKKGDFTFDIDTVTYEGTDFVYAIAEIELMVEDKNDVAAATKRIVDLSQHYGIAHDDVLLGKVGIYIKRERPEHFAVLVAAGVLPA